MRKLSYAAALLLLSLVGCMQESNLTEPVNGIEKTPWKSIILLPAKSYLSTEDVFTSSQQISGATGGEIHMIKNYQAMDGHTVSIDCKLTVPSSSLSFGDSRDITMQISDEAGVEFFPSMTFDQPVVLNLTISGLNLDGVNPNDVSFYYVDPNGSLAPTVNDGVTVDLATGTLKVINAQLPHFSRWAYAR